ncbi:MAG: hypothetical protein EBU90_30180, partial [Proteobacteria bacterium]|nr:hypothetical protein [Pseudomonadota bacterium]NBP16897.1 hypothetical protein [bacterium]
MFNLFKSPKKQEQVVKQDATSLLVKQFNGLNIQVYGTYEEPLFKAKDIGDLLEIKNIRDTVASLDDNCKIKSNVGNADVGNSSNTWLLTEDGLYELLFISRKPIAKQFRIWVRNIIKEIRLKGKYDLQEQLKLKEAKEVEYQRQLQAKEQELLKYKEKTYEEIEKPGHLYVIKTDGGTKVGKTKDEVHKRIKGLQTGNVNNIEVILDYKTSNADLLEKIVHYVLDRYRCNSNREFFDCDIVHIERVVRSAGAMIDTLKSCYQHISRNEFDKKLSSKIGVQIENTYVESEISLDDSNEYCQDDNNFYNWLDENICYKQGSVVKLNDVCELYLGKKVNNKKMG